MWLTLRLAESEDKKRLSLVQSNVSAALRRMRADCRLRVRADGSLLSPGIYIASESSRRHADQLSQLKKPSRALELSTDALKSNPNNAKASFRRAKAFRELGRSREALAVLRELEARLQDPEVARERERVEKEVKEKEKEGMKGFKGLFAK